MESTTFSLTELPRIANNILKHIQPGDIVGFSGELAAGKTTLIQAILKEMGYQETVSSPTFVIEHRYPVQYRTISEVVHLDLYRLDQKALAHFDWAEYQQPNQVTLVEWPENAGTLLPEKLKTVSLAVAGPTKRTLTFLNWS